MSAAWPKVRLGEVLRRSEERCVPTPGAAYREITVRLWGKGVIERGRTNGGALSGQRFIARVGQFIVSRIDSRNGAMGIVPPTLDGALVTNDFPLFSIDQTRLLRAFMDWLCRTQSFVELCMHASEGTTNRVRLQEDRFLALEIPLPSLAEQRRIVSRIEELAVQISEARTLHRQAAEETDTLLISMAHRTDLNEKEKDRRCWKQTFLHEVLRLVDDSHKVLPDSNYLNFGIYSFGRGLFHKQSIEGMATSAHALRKVQKGQFVYSRLFAFEGAYGMVTEEFDGFYVSNEYPTFECVLDKVRPEFLVSYFRSPKVWKELSAGSKGLGDRRQRVQPDRILAYSIWLPPMSWQNRIAEVYDMSKAVRRTQSETAAELDALLPAILDRAFKGEF